MCCLLIPEKLAAQSELYAEIDQRIKIDVPNVPLSMLEISVTGGTIKPTTSPYYDIGIMSYKDEKFKRHKRGVSTYWIVHPSWVLAEGGRRPEFVITVSARMGDKTKVLATKKYILKTAFYLDARKDVHTITPEDLLKDDIILVNSNVGNVFNLIYYASNGKSVSPPAEHFMGRFTEKEKQVLHDLKIGSKMYIKFPGSSRTIELIMGE